jgi:hypothetical protein
MLSLRYALRRTSNHVEDVSDDGVRVVGHVFPVEAQDTKSQRDKPTLPARIILAWRSTCVPLLAVQFYDDPKLGIGEVDTSDERTVVAHLMLRHRLRKTRPPHQLDEPSLEDAAWRTLAGDLALDDGEHNVTSGPAKSTELFPSLTDPGERKPAAPQPVIQELLETVGVDHRAEIQQGSKRAGNRNALELRDVTGIEVQRLMPHHVTAVPSPVPQSGDLDESVVAVDEAVQCRG